MSETTQRRFGAFIEPHLAPLKRTAYRLCRSVADAEDLVQDVCLRAFEHWQREEAVASPRAWLMRVQYNLHVDAVRRDVRARTDSLDDPRAESGPAAGADASRGADADAEVALAIEALNRAWPALTPDQQALLALQAEGYSQNELTEITGLPLSALKARLHRARVRLGKLMQTEAGGPTATASGEKR